MLTLGSAPDSRYLGISISPYDAHLYYFQRECYVFLNVLLVYDIFIYIFILYFNLYFFLAYPEIFLLLTSLLFDCRLDLHESSFELLASLMILPELVLCIKSFSLVLLAENAVR